MNLAVPFKTETVDISAGVHTFVGAVSGIYCNADGTVFAQLIGDAAPKKFIVKAGSVLHGAWKLVEDGAGGTTLTAEADMHGIVVGT